MDIQLQDTNLNLLIIIVTLVIFSWRTIVGAKQYQQLKLETQTGPRQKIMASWAIEVFVLFALGAVLILSLIGRLPTIVAMPAEFTPLVSFYPDEQERKFVGFAIAGGLLMGAFGNVLVTYLKRNANPDDTENQYRTAGDFSALLPRNRPETIWAIVLSFSAGISEELMFRLALPLLLTLLIGNAWIGFLLSITIFGLMHYYQGWQGVLATTFAALLFSVVYLYTGGLLIPIVMHIFMDLNGLVFVPMANRKSSSH